MSNNKSCGRSKNKEGKIILALRKHKEKQMHALSKDKILAYRFAPMPEIVRVSPILTPGAKILYNQIISYFWQKDNTVAWPSQEELAFKLSMSIRGIRKQLKELKDVKLIETERIGLGKPNRTYLLEPQPDLLHVEQNGNGGYQPKSGKRKHVEERAEALPAHPPKETVPVQTEFTDIPTSTPTIRGDEERAEALPARLPENLTEKRPQRKQKEQRKYRREELLEKLKELDRKEKLNNTSSKGSEPNGN